MQRPWRITEIWQKTLYIVVGWAVPAGILLVLRTWLLDQNSILYASISFVLSLTYTLIGVRTFRGYREPVAPPRPWWRWTGRPRAAFWIAALYLFTLPGEIGDFWPRHGLAAPVPVLIVTVAMTAIVFVGYLNSFFRLRQHPELWSERRRDRAGVEPETS